MRKIVAILTVFMFINGCVLWRYAEAQEKPLTPAGQIESLTNEKAQSEFNYHSASIKALVAEDRLRVLQKKYDLLLVQSQKLTAEKIALMGELKAANAKVVQLEVKPEEGKDEVSNKSDID